MRVPRLFCSMRSGACGINLTQANRVFILDPGTFPPMHASEALRYSLRFLSLVTNHLMMLALLQSSTQVYWRKRSDESTDLDKSVLWK